MNITDKNEFPKVEREARGRPQKEVIRSQTVIRAVGDWLFRGSRVYRLCEPDRILKQRKIHWGRQTCDVEDEAGTVFYDVPWDSLEFWDEVEFNLPDDD